ncbi:GIN domain-containing protein [Nonlabens xiamenensis]|uniref:GIN domain-containing protein n=1 Tax=Nonlabens xiamenensis TaxID=2341043 RepID=UPI000F60A2EE|nr:DUF2807 domain-containing protein [Nonlabens xiamenensis]
MKNAFLLLAIMATSVCVAQSIQEVDSFSKIMIQADADVTIMKSTKDQVVFNAPDDQLSGFTIDSKNGNLVIKQNANSIDGLKIRIYTNSLKALSVSGRSDVNLQNFTYESNMVIQASNSATVNTGNTQINDLKVIRSEDSKVVALKADKTDEVIRNG